MAAMPASLRVDNVWPGLLFVGANSDHSQPNEYTCNLRRAWASLLHEHGAESLDVRNRKSWVRLWGRLGAEMYECFRDGDELVRGDMIHLANREGGWRGRAVAVRLEEWRREIAQGESGCTRLGS